MVYEIEHQRVRAQLIDLQEKHAKVGEELSVTQQKNSNLVTENASLKVKVAKLEEDFLCASRKLQTFNRSSSLNAASRGVTRLDFWATNVESDPLVLDQLRRIEMLMIRNDEQGGLYKGWYGDFEKVFISPTQLCIEEYLGLTNDGVLKIDDIIEFNRKYLIVENVTPVIPFFQGLYDEYKDNATLKKGRAEWIEYCELSRVVGDVTEGWRYLNEKAFSCAGHMEGLIFVDKHHRGLLLPRVQRPTSENEDFVSLVGIVKEIILMEPSSGYAENIEDDISVPDSLRSFLKSAQLVGVHDSWLFDPPMFWQPLKSIFFIVSVDHLLKRDPVFYQMLFQVMDGVEPPRGTTPGWAHSIHAYPELRKVYSRGLYDEDLGVPRNYRLKIHKIRFSRNALMHCNVWDLLRILQELQKLFKQNLTVEIFYSICALAETATKAEFLKWTRRIFYG